MSSTNSPSYSAFNTHSYIDTISSVYSSSISSSASLSISGSSSKTDSSSVSPSVSGSSSKTDSSSVSLSLSGSSSKTDFSSVSLSVSGSSSKTDFSSVSPSVSGSSSKTDFSSVTLSYASTPSSSPFNTRSYCNSISANRTFSGTATFSSSTSLSKTSSASYYWRPKIALPPAIPADLANLSADQIAGAITDLGNYDPSVIKDNLQILGAAALFKMDGPLIIATDTFSLAMAKLSNSSDPLSVGPIAISVPTLNISGAAASSVIQWSSSPYANSSTDSSVISMSIINTAGSSVSVKNLSTPIKMDWKLTIADDDPRFLPPPTYLARCDTGVIYKGIGNLLELYNGVNYGNKWLVPCLMGSYSWINCSSGDTVKNFVCPTPKIVHRCLYWSKSLGAWSDEGCTAIDAKNGSMTCLCDHLTDFSARVDAVLSENQAIFDNAANVYSLEGLVRFVQWYAIFGGIALVTFLLGLFVVRVDQVAIGKYIKALCQNDVISEMLKTSDHTPVYVYDAFSTVSEVYKKKDKKKKNAVELNIIQRILVQHSRLGFLFRFDPRLSRLFRLLSIFLLQFHSLFITALLYGFTYGAGGKSEMMWYDTILLALITTSLNIPVVKILISSMNTVGLEEFKVQFPILFAEYKRRMEFEKVALIYLAKKRGLLLNDADDLESADSNSGFHESNDGEEDTVLDIMTMYFCCRSRQSKVDSQEELTELSVTMLLRRLATIVKESYPYIEAYSNFWGSFPCHTKVGCLYILLSSGWIGWCLNYLLLFAAAHDRSVGENVLKSYATSEITTVFLTQPVIIGVSYVFYKLLAKYGHRLPDWLKDRLMPKSVRSIPALYYFNDPWVGIAKTSFTSEYAYNLFVKCPSNATGVAEEVYANQRAITYDEEVKDKKVVVELKILYKKVVTAWDDIKNNR